MDWLTSVLESLTLGRIAAGAGLFLGSFIISALVVAIVIVKVPENYFSSHYQRDFMPGASWATRWGATVLKNLIGIVLILAGIVMLIGPGQGILTILIGLVMVDIPGKRPLEARIIKRPAVLAAINGLRGRYNKPPLLMD